VFKQQANLNAMFYFNGNLHVRSLSYNYLSVIFACYFSEQMNYAVLSLLLPDQYTVQGSCNTLTFRDLTNLHFQWLSLRQG